MEVRYKREINHNYMIMDAPDQGGGYECRMLASNSIEGLLRFRVRQYEEKREFYYEITSRQPLNRLLEQRKIKGTELRSLLLGIAGVLTKIEEYLLKEEQLMLDPEHIYIDPDRFSVYLCLLPGYSSDFPAALSGLLQYLLEKINHQDREGVVLAYNLYQESLRENYGMADLLRHLSGSSDMVFENHNEKETWLEEQEDVEKPVAHNDRWAKGERDGEFQPDNGWNGRPRQGINPVETHTGEQRSEESKKTDKPKIRFDMFLPFTVVLAASEGAVWYFIGIEGLAKYGPWLGVFLILAFIAVMLIVWRKKEENGEEESSFSVVEKNTILPAVNNKSDRNEMTYRFQPENREVYESRTDREERQREQAHSKEEGTVLLAENVAREEFPLFENLSREGDNIQIQYVPYVIGKHPELADYCLKRPTVSRLHVRVDLKEGVYIVTDLNSTNGTAVEGYQLQANETVSIKNGDIITIADIRYRFIERKYP